MRRHFEEGARIADELRTAAPDDFVAVTCWIQTKHDRAWRPEIFGDDPEQVIRVRQEFLAAAEETAERFPEEPFAVEKVVFAARILGDALLAEGEIAEARSFYALSERVCDRLLASDPHNAGYISMKAWCHERQGSAAMAAGDARTAHELWTRFHDMHAELMRSEPNQLDWMHWCAIAKRKMATASHQLGERAEAGLLARRAVDLLDRVIDGQRYLDSALLNKSAALRVIGEVAAAREDLDALGWSLRERAAVNERRAVRDPASEGALENIAWCHAAIAAHVMLPRGDLGGARAEALIARRMVERGLDAGVPLSALLASLTMAEQALMECALIDADPGEIRSLGEMWRRTLEERIPILLEELDEAGPEGVAALNGAAWAMLQLEPPDLRDDALPFALDWARTACRATNRKDSPSLETLALAEFRSGRIADAIATQREAIALVSPEAAERNGSLDRLAEYEAVLTPAGAE